ncbi:MAG: mannose-6-phosphate isomerase, partial [Clostridia bacterium]|nr:mannose-6-phosphate isomerase [Clostridia bacterium]
KAGVSKIEGTDVYLDQLIKEHKSEILGSKNELGVLVKFLDSAIRLPIQAHPDKAFSRKYFSSDHGKEESWIILGKREGGCIYFGFDEKVTREDFAKAIEESATNKSVMEPLLVRREVEVGDVVFVPAKAVHAIGAGCLILEIQEPTDFTIQPEYWCGDTPLSNEVMYLGLDKETALDCFDFSPITDFKVIPKVVEEKDEIKIEALIDENLTQNFAVNRITLNNGPYIPQKDAAIYVITEGAGTISGNGYQRELKQGDYFLMPHLAIGKFKIDGSLTIMECYSSN